MSMFAGLSNEHLVFIYLKFSKYAKFVRNITERRYVTKSIYIGSTNVEIKKDLDDEDIDYMLSIPVIKYFLDIEAILCPIVEMIQEADPELYKKVEDVFNEYEPDSEGFSNFSESFDEDDFL